MTTARTSSLHAFPLPDAGTERFDTLARLGNVTIERIMSSGTQPIGHYCQEQDEWVLLLSGEAELVIDETSLYLKAGDHVLLPARVPHELRRTSANALWLAVQVHPTPPSLSGGETGAA